MKLSMLDSTTRPMKDALLAPVAVLAAVLAIPLCFAEGRAWLRDVFVGCAADPDPVDAKPD